MITIYILADDVYVTANLPAATAFPLAKTIAASVTPQNEGSGLGSSLSNCLVVSAYCVVTVLKYRRLEAINGSH